MSRKPHRPARRSASGVRSVRGADNIRISAVICVGRDSPLPEAVAAHLADPSAVVFAHDSFDLYQARREIPAAALFAVGATAPVEIPNVLAEIDAYWPTAPRLFFSRYARPQLPSSPNREVEDVELSGPHADLDELADYLTVRIEAALAWRMGQIAAGRAFAERYGLAPLGELLVVAMSLSVPYERWGSFIGKDDNRKFNSYCSSHVYPRVPGRPNQQNLLARVLSFRERWRLEHSASAEPTRLHAAAGARRGRD